MPYPIRRTVCAWFPGIQGISLRYLYFIPIMVGGRPLAEQMIDMGTAVKPVSILSIKVLQHSYHGLDRQSK